MLLLLLYIIHFILNYELELKNCIFNLKPDPKVI